MSGPSEIPSPMEILARVDAALEASGLKMVGSEREPLPLFWQLLNEWLLSQEQSEVEAGNQVKMRAVLAGLAPGAVKKALQRIRQEALDLCRAHQSLNDWNQREMDAVYQNLLPTAGLQEQLAGGGF